MSTQGIPNTRPGLFKAITIATHSRSEAQKKFGSLPCRKKLRSHVGDHAHKLLQQPVVGYDLLLHGVPDCSRHQADGGNQEAQGREGESGTCKRASTIG